MVRVVLIVLCQEIAFLHVLQLANTELRVQLATLLALHATGLVPTNATHASMIQQNPHQLNNTTTRLHFAIIVVMATSTPMLLT